MHTTFWFPPQRARMWRSHREGSVQLLLFLSCLPLFGPSPLRQNIEGKDLLEVTNSSSVFRLSRIKKRTFLIQQQQQWWHRCVGIRNIRSQDYSFPGTFVPMMELLFSGTFVPWNIRSLDHSFPRPNAQNSFS